MERNSKSGIISLILFTISMYVPHLFFCNLRITTLLNLLRTSVAPCLNKLKIIFLIVTHFDKLHNKLYN